MNIMKQIEKVVNATEKIDYTMVHIEIETEKDRFIIEKDKTHNKIGFNSNKEVK